MSKRKKNRRGRIRTAKTRLQGHRRVGKDLVSPFNQAMKSLPLEMSIWSDRMPEFLWMGLLAHQLPRDAAIREFQSILQFIRDHEEQSSLHDLRMSGIARLDDGLRGALIGRICQSAAASSVLSLLRWFDSLPARGDWSDHLPAPATDAETRLKATFATMMWRQSTTVTDCIWMLITAKMLAGKMTLDPSLKTQAERLANYPNDYEEIQGFLRTNELSLSGLDNKPTWAASCWDELWSRTECVVPGRRPIAIRPEQLSHQRMHEMMDSLRAHWRRTRRTTATDARHDGVFGMAFYSMRLLSELMSIGNSVSVMGRLGLRTLIEARINLAYLINKDSNDLWQSWRKYGSGQAKLVDMKFDTLEFPEYIDIDTIRWIASEDRSSEYSDVKLGDWNSLDLRRRSIQAREKNIYDAHYPWNSAYSHGAWGAVREAGYVMCANPLHRFHLVPDRAPLEDCLSAAVKVVDGVLELVDRAYPSFDARLSSV